MSEEDKTISRKTGAKVKTAVFGKDLFVELKEYPLSKAGNKIDIVNTGAGYFMPEIGPRHFLYWPMRRKYIFFGKWVYDPIYFALRRGRSCINFGLDSPEAYGPDVEQIDSAISNNLAGQIGADINKGTPWHVWVLIVTNILMLLLIMNMSGVLR